MDVFTLLHQRPHSVLGESFRSLYNACRRRQPGRANQVFMVTSALPAEGKTTTAIGLACTAALDGSRTVLVDLDRGSKALQGSLWSKEDDHSLDDYFENRCNLSDILHVAPEMPNLELVTAKARGGGLASVLRSQQLEAIVHVLRDEYDTVVIDAPPLLVVEDAMRLAALVDGVILVTARGRTSENALLEAGERLALHKAPLLGAILNFAEAKAKSRRSYLGTGASRRQFDRYFA